MRFPRSKSNCAGFTLFEVLVVLLVIAVLAVVLIAYFQRPRAVYYGSCLNNQKQIDLGFALFKMDNDDKYPWQLSTATNGTLEFVTNGSAAAQFQPESNYIKSMSVYLCPTDRTRHFPTNYDSFADSNTSYFVNVDAPPVNPAAILTGDRNMRVDGRVVGPGLLLYTNGNRMDWTHELHDTSMLQVRGVVGFGDCHSEVITGLDLTAAFVRQGLARDRLAVP